MTTLRHSLAVLLIPIIVAFSGCASTTTSQLVPSPQSPVCQSSAKALILWMPQWRPDQKDVHERETAAAEGMTQFFANSGCFSSAVVQRIAQPSAASIAAAVAEAQSRYDKLVIVTVRELGPIVKIGSSIALVEGGTEVVLDLAEYLLPAFKPHRVFSVQWRDGGPGVIKGVASLSQDIQFALAAGMQPAKQ